MLNTGLYLFLSFQCVHFCFSLFGLWCRSHGRPVSWRNSRIIISLDVLDTHPDALPKQTHSGLSFSAMRAGQLYIWESTLSGQLNDGVNNIHDESFAGVQVRNIWGLYAIFSNFLLWILWFVFIWQVRELDAVVRAALGNTKSTVAVCSLPTQHSQVSANQKARFTQFFDDHNGMSYNFNPMEGCCAYVRQFYASCFRL